MEHLIGLYAAKKAVQEIGNSNRAHSLLFYGPDGAGKTQLAYLLAKRFLSFTSSAKETYHRSPTFNSSPISSTVDFLHITPQPPSMIIRLDNITPSKFSSENKTLSIQEFVRTRPLKARNKVILIEQAECMNQEASNALLKTLEEPSEFVQIILTTSNRSLISSTILSRCIPIVCELPTPEDLKKHFGELSKHEALFSDHSPGIIQKIRNHSELYRDFMDLLESTVHLHTVAALKISEKVREWASKYEKHLEVSARLAHSEAFRCIALWLNHHPSFQNRLLVQKSIEFHRRVLSNANPNYLFDSLFVDLFCTS